MDNYLVVEVDELQEQSDGMGRQAAGDMRRGSLRADLHPVAQRDVACAPLWATTAPASPKPLVISARQPPSQLPSAPAVGQDPDITSISNEIKELRGELATLTSSTSARITAAANDNEQLKERFHGLNLKVMERLTEVERMSAQLVKSSNASARPTGG